MNSRIKIFVWRPLLIALSVLTITFSLKIFSDYLSTLENEIVYRGYAFIFLIIAIVGLIWHGIYSYKYRERDKKRMELKFPKRF